SLNSFAIAVDTLPESTIMESTTMSDPSGSTPNATTEISPLAFFSSTALMLLEPISNPTIAFAPPNPNMLPPYVLIALNTALTLRARCCPCCLGTLLAFVFSAHTLAFHPGIQDRLLDLPAVPEF